MNFNDERYDPIIIKETIQGKEITCDIIIVDKDYITLDIGNNFLFKILTVFYDIENGCGVWRLTVVPIDPSSPIIDISKYRECKINDLKIINNFYEQCKKK